MESITSGSKDDQKIAALAKQIYDKQIKAIACRTDHLFAGLMAAQWLFAIIIAVLVSPRAWSGSNSFPHPHVVYALWLGGLFTAVPVYFALAHNGAVITRHVIAVAQMLMGGLLIHLTGGRIETHFHVFG